MAKASSIQDVNYSARDRVRDKLQVSILNGKYSSGTRLTQPRLAAEFGVSQSVVRESLLELKAWGLVEFQNDGGAIVSNLDPNKLIQLFQLREVLEGLAARLCCERASRENIRELSAMAQKIFSLHLAGKYDERSQVDGEFHRKVAEISSNDMLVQLTASYRILRKCLRSPWPFRKKSHDEHLDIIKAIEENCPDDAERLMREHLRSARDTLEQKIIEGKVKLEWMQ